MSFGGAEEHLETAFFVFTYRNADAAAVAAIAPQSDVLYATMRRNFGLPNTPIAEKVPIAVNVIDVPGNPAYLSYPTTISVPSPALYAKLSPRSYGGNGDNAGVYCDGLWS